jgi:TolA-binding protein
MENMSEQMESSQGLLADMVSQMKDMQSQLDKMNGRLEVLEHKNQNIDLEALKKMNENVTLLQTQQQNDSTQLTQIQNELKEQRAYLEKVTAGLASLSKEKASSGKKKSAKDELNSALTLIRREKFANARESLEGLIDNSELSPGDVNKLFHGLGRVEYFSKNYDKALVYFSKIYTKFPKSSLAPSSLLYIGRTLKKMGKKDEAVEALNKVAEDYPKSKEASEAKKEL